MNDVILNKKVSMVGFRNVLVHQYQQLDLAIMIDVIEHHLDEPLHFADPALSLIE